MWSKIFRHIVSKNNFKVDLIYCLYQYQDEQTSWVCILEVAEVKLSDIASAKFLTKVRQAASLTACCVVHAVGEAWECGCSPRSTDHEVCHLSYVWQSWITQFFHTPGNRSRNHHKCYTKKLIKKARSVVSFSNEFNFLCATAWSLILMEEHRLSMFENKMLRRICRPKRNK